MSPLNAMIMLSIVQTATVISPQISRGSAVLPLRAPDLSVARKVTLSNAELFPRSVGQKAARLNKEDVFPPSFKCYLPRWMVRAKEPGCLTAAKGYQVFFIASYLPRKAAQEVAIVQSAIEATMKKRQEIKGYQEFTLGSWTIFIAYERSKTPSRSTGVWVYMVQDSVEVLLGIDRDKGEVEPNVAKTMAAYFSTVQLATTLAARGR